MIKILIVEDNEHKKNNIQNLILERNNISIENIRIASAINEARKLLYTMSFDLMILDLVLPNELGGDCEAEYGVKFLEEIQYNPSIIPPIHIVGLTGFTNEMSDYHQRFVKKLWNLIEYEANAEDWQDQLNSIIHHLVKTRQRFLEASINQPLNKLFSDLKDKKYPNTFLGYNLNSICQSLISIVERIFDVPQKFENGTRAKNINLNTMIIESEYDFQNIIHIVLRPWIPTLEAENIAIIFDGNKKRADFSINGNLIIFEVKYIDTTGKKNDTLKTLKGLKDFYLSNSNIQALIFILLVEDSVKIDKHKIEAEFSFPNRTPSTYVSIIFNKLKK